MAAFPEVDLDASGPSTTFHKVVLTTTVKQDGSPWTSQVTTYEHMTNAIVAIITGQIASLGGKLGPKGTKPKNQNFDVEIRLDVDGQAVTNPPAAWTGVSREYVLAAERALLKMWMTMNEDSIEINKAHSKI